MYLEARHLTCRRADRTLFKGLSFALGAGELLEIRGANGSGKSRLLRILAGVTRDWSGSLDVREAALYIGHENGLHPQLTVKENLEWAASLVGAARDAYVPGLAAFKVRHLLHHMCGALSVGQSRRVALSRLVFESARLWLLDEPTNSLDAQGRACFRALLVDHLHRGGAVALATHREEALGERSVSLDARRDDGDPVKGDEAFLAQHSRRLRLGPGA